VPLTSSVRVGRRRVRLGLALLASVVAAGVLWYWQVEGFSVADALYQSVMTVTTVGFAEVEPLGTRGRIFTTVFIVVGVGLALYAIVGLIEDVLEHQLGQWGRRRMEHQIGRVSEHVIVCGFGRVGARDRAARGRAQPRGGGRP
jgi:voltage-gated potassium channel